MKFVLVCPDVECENKKHYTPGKYSMKFNKKEKRMIPEYIGEPQVCPICGSKLIFVEVDNTIPEFNVGVFRGLPDDKKKEILRQRFDKDMKRGGSDEKESRKRNAMEKLLGYGK